MGNLDQSISNSTNLDESFSNFSLFKPFKKTLPMRPKNQGKAEYNKRLEDDIRAKEAEKATADKLAEAEKALAVSLAINKAKDEVEKVTTVVTEPNVANVNREVDVEDSNKMNPILTWSIVGGSVIILGTVAYLIFRK